MHLFPIQVPVLTWEGLGLDPLCGRVTATCCLALSPAPCMFEVLVQVGSSACQVAGSGRVGAMARYSESEAVFKSRLKSAGFVEGEITKISAGVSTLRELAFVSSFAPGASDDAPLIAQLKALLGLANEPSIQQCARWRSVFHEAFAVTTAEMKQVLESGEGAGPRKLSQPERSQRLTAQRARLAGVDITGMLEPSDSLIDACAAVYESNRLTYVAWETCTCQEAELTSGAKKETSFTLEANGSRLKLEPRSAPGTCDTSSEVHVQLALQRRALALDQCNLVAYAKMQVWHERLIRARLEAPPEGFAKPSFKQLIAADKKLFLELAARTKDGIQSTAAGRPIDLIIDSVMDLSCVMCLFQPLPAPPAVRERPGPYRKGEKGGGKGKANTAYERGRMPKGLEGCLARTKKGQAICFNFNLGTCGSKGHGKDPCRKGLHICAVPSCGANNHGAHQCPKKQVPPQVPPQAPAA